MEVDLLAEYQKNLSLDRQEAFQRYYLFSLVMAVLNTGHESVSGYWNEKYWLEEDLLEGSAFTTALSIRGDFVELERQIQLGIFCEDEIVYKYGISRESVSLFIDAVKHPFEETEFWKGASVDQKVMLFFGTFMHMLQTNIDGLIKFVKVSKEHMLSLSVNDATVIFLDVSDSAFWESEKLANMLHGVSVLSILKSVFFIARHNCYNPGADLVPFDAYLRLASTHLVLHLCISNDYKSLRYEYDICNGSVSIMETWI